MRAAHCAATPIASRDFDLKRSTPNQFKRNRTAMSQPGDYEIAIEEGATVVRVGQAIFGARSTPDSHYWPTESSAPPR